jgi:NhaP-type Na+/H+ or K+/H+ antiporter
VTFQTLGFGAEAIVFVIVGLSITFYLQRERCWPFVLAQFFIIIIGRFMAIILSYYMFSCCSKDENEKLSFRELLFISYAALIRGAIAFGLVTNIPDEFEHKEVVESTTLLLVIITTIVFGTFCSMMQKILLPDPPKQIESELFQNHKANLLENHETA